MVEPDDFGLSPVQTLAHVGDSARSCRHARTWKAWAEAVDALTPRLAPASEADPADPTADWHFTGLRHIRIGCRLLPAPGPPRAGIVVFHGYAALSPLAEQAAKWEALRQRGCTILAVRVRGFPGSRLDTGDWTGGTGGEPWITRGLQAADEDPTAWSFAAAAADAVAAVRALRAHLGSNGPGTPGVFAAGESFGAALALIAAAHLPDREGVARLAIGLPSMGDWSWRLAHASGSGRGAGAEIVSVLRARPDAAESIQSLLRVFDTVIHARNVRCPVLCKLAVRDDVVPAPSSAGVFNALGSDPGRKWRFITRYGHFDGGIADARRHAEFERVVDEFLDPARDPGSMVLATA